MVNSSVTPTQRPAPCPPAAFLRTGTVPPDAPRLVRYVDEDAEGNNRLVELAPESPFRRCA